MTRILVLADTLNSHGFKVTESGGIFTCSDAGNHAFLKRFPTDPSPPRMNFNSAGKIWRHLQDHYAYFKMLMDTAWKADIAVFRYGAKRKRGPRKAPAARRKRDARTKRNRSPPGRAR